MCSCIRLGMVSTPEDSASLPGPLQIEGQQSPQQLLLPQVVRCLGPSIGREHRGVEVVVEVGEPCRALVVEVGERALLESVLGVLVDWKEARWQRGDYVGLLADEVGWVEPVAPRFGEGLGCSAIASRCERCSMTGVSCRQKVGYFTSRRCCLKGWGSDKPQLRWERRADASHGGLLQHWGPVHVGLGGRDRLRRPPRGRTGTLARCRWSARHPGRRCLHPLVAPYGIRCCKSLNISKRSLNLKKTDSADPSEPERSQSTCAAYTSAPPMLCFSARPIDQRHVVPYAASILP